MVLTPPRLTGFRSSVGLALTLSLGSIGSASDAASTPENFHQYVDPLIGTGPSNAPNPVPGGTGGSVFPGATVPFGMVQFSPDTPNGEPSGYGYKDSEITGFSLTHFSGAGCRNFGDLPMMPTVGSGNVQTKIGFSHATERAEAGYYGVLLDNGVHTELTATTRSVSHASRIPNMKSPVT
ncbi:MAG: hypothetical protein FJ146_07800 [Deltaproteobacteria bacterium]|nr:hypothetical protein [Deltaproteobacteria bacterium]